MNSLQEIKKRIERAEKLKEYKRNWYQQNKRKEKTRSYYNYFKYKPRSIDESKVFTSEDIKYIEQNTFESFNAEDLYYINQLKIWKQ